MSLSEKDPRRTEPKTQGLDVVRLLQLAKAGRVDVDKVSDKTKFAIAGFLSSEGFSPEEIAGLVKAPIRTVRYWRMKFDRQVGERVRQYADAVVGGLYSTATAAKARARSEGRHMDVWAIECALVDRLIKMGVTTSAPDTVINPTTNNITVHLTLEDAFARLFASRSVAVAAPTGVIAGAAPAGDRGSA